MNENLLTALMVIAIMIPVAFLIQFATNIATSEWEKGMKMKEAADEARGAHFTLNPDMTITPGRPAKTDCSKFENAGSNGTIGPYGSTDNGTPIFDAQIYTKEDIECIQGGYGEGYGVAKYPWQTDQPVVNTAPYLANYSENKVVVDVGGPQDKDPCKNITSGVCGEEGPMGCSGDPNPPSADDIWNYKHGAFTPRQGDIMIGGCYSPSNMALMNAAKDPKSVITICVKNTTETGPIEPEDGEVSFCGEPNSTIFTFSGNGTMIKPPQTSK